MRDKHLHRQLLRLLPEDYPATGAGAGISQPALMPASQGLAICGYKVMNTVGKDITDINFSRGFSIELGSTIAVVLATVLGMPVSSTHCQIGSIVAVGVLESGLSSVRWSVFRNIVIAWLVTVPAAALASGLLLLALRSTVT